MSFTNEATKKRIIDRILADRARQPEILDQMKERQRQGIEVACQCARVLKEEFGITRVVLFGSLLTPEEMHWRSDINLAVWGLPEEEIWKAGAAVDRVVAQSGYDFPPVNLVDVRDAKPHILRAIDKGMAL